MITATIQSAHLTSIYLANDHSYEEIREDEVTYEEKADDVDLAPGLHAV